MVVPRFTSRARQTDMAIALTTAAIPPEPAMCALSEDVPRIGVVG
jgi:hypothetical protein